MARAEGAGEERRVGARRLGRALVELARPPRSRRFDVVELLAEVDGRSLVRAAERQRLTGTVHRALRELPAGATAHLDNARAELERAHTVAVARGLASLADLGAAMAALDEAGLAWVVVKGPVLAGYYYGDPGGRSYADLDLVSTRGDFRAMLVHLESSGGRLPAWNWDAARDRRLAEVSFVLRFGTPGDLHWHILPSPRLRERYRIDADAWVERRRRVALGSLVVPTFDAADTVLHLCVHSSTSGGHLLVWLKDLERAVLDPGLDWSELARRARGARLGWLTAMQLQRARTVLGADVPAEVLDELAGRRLPPSWGIPRSWAGDEVWAGATRTSMTWTRATSSGRGSTLASLATLLATELTAARARSLLGALPGVSWPSPEERLYGDGRSATGREDYLAAVEAGGW